VAWDRWSGFGQPLSTEMNPHYKTLTLDTFLAAE
jgi:hypothetical protein